MSDRALAAELRKHAEARKRAERLRDPAERMRELDVWLLRKKIRDAAAHAERLGWADVRDELQLIAERHIFEPNLNAT